MKLIEKTVNIILVSYLAVASTLVPVLAQQSAPVITSSPSKTQYTTNEVFQYQVNAYDPDGGDLTYRLLSAPDFIYLSQSGFMTIGNYMTAGSYNISFTVIDDENAAAQQSFNLVVTQAPTATPRPTSNPTPRPTSSTTPAPTQAGVTLQITKPVANTVYKQSNNDIIWEVQGNNPNLDEFVIEYSNNNGANWTRIISIGKDRRNQKWDVTNIPNGEYTLRIRGLDKGDNVLFERLSEKFKIENPADAGNTLTLGEINPADNSEIINRTPTIEANYVPSQDAEIDAEKVNIKVDGKEITDDCSINNDSLKCDVQDSLDLGEHEVTIYVVDTQEKFIEKNWKFNIIEDSISEPTSTPTPTPASAFKLPSIDLPEGIGQNLLRCCGGLFVLGIIIFLLRFLLQKVSGGISMPKLGGSKKPAEEEEFIDFKDFNTSDDNDFSIGSHTIDDYSAPVMPPAAAEEAAAAQPVQPMESPTSGDGIPDWLKGDATSEAQPVAPTGGNFTKSEPDNSIPMGSADLHDDFGLVPVDQDKDQKS